MGKFVDQFEEEIRKFTGAKRAVAVVNGTSALHAALQLNGVGHDDEVITQPLTFIATCNAISYCGAVPAFVDVDLDTMGMSPRSLKAFLEENCKKSFYKNSCFHGNTSITCYTVDTRPQQKAKIKQTLQLQTSGFLHRNNFV